MSETVVTVRDVFVLPKPGSPEESSPRWQTLRQWMSEDVKGVKTGAMPNVAAKIADLLEVPVAEIFLTSWKKTDAVNQLLEESRRTPEALMNVELAEHSINSKHQPHIEIRAKNASVKKIEFTLQLLFKLKGFSLRIQNGAIKEMQTGFCQAKGTLQYQGLAIAEKELAPIKLPATITFEASAKTDPKPATVEAPVNVNKAPETVTPLEPPKPSPPVTQQPVSPPPESYKLKPPVKVTTKITETVREEGKSEARAVATAEEVPREGVSTEEEEEREQFVL